VTLELHRRRHRGARRVAAEVNEQIENIGARRCRR
jgi:ATP-dependent protease HslVU (ClpYQ) ATPase subunit